MSIVRSATQTVGAIAPVVLVLFFLSASALFAPAQERLVIGEFSAADPADSVLPEGWAPLTFDKIDRHTRYDLVRDNGTTVLRARSDRSASGLIRKIRIDPRQYPVIQWRWKITNVFEQGDVTRKSGDDYPARIYIAFAYDPDQAGLWEKAKFGAIKAIYGEYPPQAAINYIWGSHAPVGTRVPNPFTDRVMMIAVESGMARQNTWVTETRNIYEDYRQVFGEEPPLISGVAVMTDADNTGEAAVAYYGDIVFTSGK